VKENINLFCWRKPRTWFRRHKERM